MMKKSDVLASIQRVGLLPVLRASSLEEAVAVSRAIQAGGISTLEVTMTVPGAVELIQQLVRENDGSMLIGAGTVLDPETARMCILAGAAFIVSPALNFKTIELCHRYGIAIIPGALTPTEVVTAWEAGADVIKVFPCSALGGAKYLKALKAPLPQIELIPTGGVSVATAREFMEAGAFALGVGGDLVDTHAVSSGYAEVVSEKAKQYLATIENFRSAAKA